MSSDEHKTPNNHSADTASPESSGRTLDLLKQIKNETINPKSICKADRQLMVAHFMAEGFLTGEMAEILQVADRTIERDRKDIRQANALKSDPRLVEEMVGRLAYEADQAIQRILKAARDKKATPAVRIDAQHRCYQIFSDFVQRMQSLGYLPMATHKVTADVTHHMTDVPDYPEMMSQLEHLGKILPEESEVLGQLQDQMTRAQCAEKIDEISSTTQSKGDNHEGSE